jgi:hypothetical protein
MKAVLIAIYLGGLIFTAFNLLPNPRFRRAYGVHVLSILFWPFYWGYFLLAVYLGRRKP